MRLVIDGQFLQYSLLDGDDRRCIGHLLRHIGSLGPGHHATLLLDGGKTELIDAIRAEFEPYFGREGIRLWYGAAGLTAEAETQTRALVRAMLIASLDPDAVLVPVPLGGVGTEPVLSVDQSAAPELICLIGAAGRSEKNHAPFLKSLQEQIAKAALILIPDGAPVPGYPISPPKATYTSVRDVREHLERLARRRCPAASQRPSLAFVSPMPPDRSGISFYSAELLPDLSRYYEIEIVSASEEARSEWGRLGYRVVDASDFARQAGGYDRVLYQFGNSNHHRHMFALLREHPGVAVLHEVFLSGVISDMDTSDYTPWFWYEELYRSHGYRAAAERFLEPNPIDVIWRYPCSGSVIEDARGIIVHSREAENQIERWYGKVALQKVSVVPHLRAPARDVAARERRTTLGFAGTDIITCSFGGVSPTKLNHRLLDSWAASRLASDPRCKLVFVGGDATSVYGRELSQAVRDKGIQDQVRFTGWIDAECFQDYLAVADLAVQLRDLSRGETSGAALDCMNHGVPLIVNAHGAMAELPEDAVLRLEDAFDDSDLTAALEALAASPELRRNYSERARLHVRMHHAPENAAARYAAAIEDFYARPRGTLPKLFDEMAAAASESGDPRAPERLAAAVALSVVPSTGPRQLLVDISALVRQDLRTGIERVARALVKELVTRPPDGFRVEPIRAEGRAFSYAREYTMRLLGVQHRRLVDEPVEFRAGDLYFMPDLEHQSVIRNRATYRAMRRHGVAVNFFVHDLLPILQPQFFPHFTAGTHAQWLEVVAEADGAICPSRSVAGDLADWLASHAPRHGGRLRIGVSPHGADITASSPSIGLERGATKLLASLAGSYAYLMVGTVEPRKGHADVLDAFEALWAKGSPDRLVIVGKPGWMVDSLARRIRRHAERNRRLFWIEKASDEYLDRLYAVCDCLIMASHGEGFGLPLVEAASRGMPVVARDIPVFREIAGDHACYFGGTSQLSLEAAIMAWRELAKLGQAPDSRDIRPITWEESAANLKRLLVACVPKGTADAMAP